MFLFSSFPLLNLLAQSFLPHVLVSLPSCPLPRSEGSPINHWLWRSLFHVKEDLMTLSGSPLWCKVVLFAGMLIPLHRSDKYLGETRLAMNLRCWAAHGIPWVSTLLSPHTCLAGAFQQLRPQIRAAVRRYSSTTEFLLLTPGLNLPIGLGTQNGEAGLLRSVPDSDLLCDPGNVTSPFGVCFPSCKMGTIVVT